MGILHVCRKPGETKTLACLNNIAVETGKAGDFVAVNVALMVIIDAEHRGIEGKIEIAVARSEIGANVYRPAETQKAVADIRSDDDLRMRMKIDRLSFNVLIYTAKPDKLVAPIGLHHKRNVIFITLYVVSINIEGFIQQPQDKWPTFKRLRNNVGAQAICAQHVIIIAHDIQRNADKQT